MTERDIRSELLNTLLTTPHRNLAALYPMHQTMIEQDPIFYVHMAAWYADFGQVRDHKEMFVIMLCLSSFEGHRDTGLALLRRMPPYEVARVVDFIKGYEVKKRVRTPPAAVVRKPAVPAAPAPRKRGGFLGLFRHIPERMKPEVEEVLPAASAAPGSAAAPTPRKPAAPGFETVSENVGLFRNVPRSMRTEIERYLHAREANPQAFDRTVLAARKSLRRLYAGLHIQPGPRAQAVLFDEQPPEGSLSFVVKQISKAATPAEQARVIAEHRIPYRVASTIIKEMSPMVIAALVEVMTPQEVINNVASLKARGGFDNPDIKALIETKISAAKTDKRVSAFKAKVAAEAVEATGELAEELEAVTEARVKATGKITRPTALLVDKSGSMSQAIEVGRQLGALASTICEADLFVYAFDTVAFPVQPKDSSLAGWEKAFAGIHAAGGTSCGVPLEWMRRHKQRVEQIVLVTDEDENTAPRFQDAYEAYAAEMGLRPAVILVKIGTASNLLEQACNTLGIAPQMFEFRGDYYALPNLIPMLTYPSLMEMVMEVLSYPLPQRKPA